MKGSWFANHNQNHPTTTAWRENKPYASAFMHKNTYMWTDSRVCAIFNIFTFTFMLIMPLCYYVITTQYNHSTWFDIQLQHILALRTGISSTCAKKITTYTKKCWRLRSQLITTRIHTLLTPPDESQQMTPSTSWFHHSS